MKQTTGFSTESFASTMLNLEVSVKRMISTWRPQHENYLFISYLIFCISIQAYKLYFCSFHQGKLSRGIDNCLGSALKASFSNNFLLFELYHEMQFQTIQWSCKKCATRGWCIKFATGVKDITILNILLNFLTSMVTNNW